MTFTFLQLFPFQRILQPNLPWGWLAWLFLLTLTAWIAWRGRVRQKRWSRREWAEFVLLTLFTPLAILIFTLRLPAEGVLPIPELGQPALGALVPIFTAIPWMLAAARLGTLPAVLLATEAGLLLALWDTSSPFTPLEFGFLGALFGTALRQPYSTRLFNWLRQPLIAAVLLVVLYPAVFFSMAFFWTGNNPLASMDFARSRVLGATLAFALPLVIGAVVLHIVQLRWPAMFLTTVESRSPAPNQRSLEARFLFTLGPVVLLAFLALGALGWWSAERSASQLISERLSSSVSLAADSVPFLLETGQNLALQLAADEGLADASQAAALGILQAHLRSVPYFEQLTLLDTGGNTIAGVPVADFFALSPSPAELEAVSLSIQGVPLQFFSVAPVEESGRAAQLVFVAAVRNTNEQVRGVLVGRTRLSSNPFAQPILQNLESINALGGQGFLIDGDGRIAMAPDSSALLQPYNGRSSDSELTYEDIGPDGARRMVHYAPAIGSNWAIVAQLPASLSQQLALGTTLSLVVVLFLLALIAFVLFRFSLRSVITSLNELVTETRRIGSGDLKAPLSQKGADEIGRLSEAFELMRQTLRTRSEENERLFAVSQGIAANLDISAHIDPILDAALASGATSARLVFAAEANANMLTGFGKGTNVEQYESLDDQFFSLTRTQARVLISNPNRAKLKIEKGVPVPEAIAAFALASGNDRLGVLWLAYDKPQRFAGESLRYLETLADQAAKAAANTRLYLAAQLGRQRLESILENTPDPIIVSDQAGYVLMANKAAHHLFVLKNGMVGLRVDKVIGEKALLSLYENGSNSSIEVQLSDGRVYQAQTSRIGVEGSMGHALVLHDVSDYKNIETLRTDFLSTLSHDLRDPLNLVQGYISMLGMVGELNQQQLSYVRKIEHSLENISLLTRSLLDLDRLQTGRALQLQSFSLPALLDELVIEIEPRARQKKIEIKIRSITGKASNVKGDRTLLQRAFYNLLDNAIRFSPRSENVDLSLNFTERTVLVAVKDRGAGIASMDLSNIFGPQKAGDKASLGLSIVKSIIERHGGRVWAESELGLGSTFFAEIPLNQAK